jgi:hypothetical protein
MTECPIPRGPLDSRADLQTRRCSETASPGSFDSTYAVQVFRCQPWASDMSDSAFKHI